jgi:hypothetical protein
MSMRSFAWRHLPRRVLLAYAAMTFDHIPDRIYMRETIVPRIASHGSGRVLNIGVHYYTVRLHQQLMRLGSKLYTADVDPAKAMWGVKGSHSICSALELENCFEPDFFDSVIFSGVLGYGINDLQMFNKTLCSIAKVSSLGSILIVGWDDNMFPDPLKDGNHTSKYVPFSELLGSSRVRRLNGMFDQEGVQCEKVYDVLCRRF